MESTTLASSVFLLAGGDAPGVHLLERDTDTPRLILQYEAGRSVYAMDVSLAAELVAVGDRAGIVDVLQWSDRNASSAGLRRVHRLNQGSPVLSVSVLDDSLVAVSDVAGRCFLWDTSHREPMPLRLEAADQRVCSLVYLGGQKLWGLTEDGRILLWDTTSMRIVESWGGPKPPRPLALVRLTYWPACDAILYPTAGGRLVSVYRHSGEFSTRKIHEGACYACLPHGPRLITIGADDGMLRRWGDPNGTAEASTRIRRGIISAEVSDGTSDYLVTIARDGTASVVCLQDAEVDCGPRLEGTTFRSAVGLSPCERDPLNRELHLNECRRVASAIEIKLANQDFDDLEELFHQLSELGAEDVSLTLQIRRAILQEDPLAELRAWRQLVYVMPLAKPKLLRRYADLLAELGLFADAAEMYGQIPVEELGDVLRGWVAEASEAIASPEWIADSSVSLATTIGAASVLNRSLRGRWVIEAGDTIHSSRRVLGPDNVASEYEQIRRERGEHALPPASCDSLARISRAAVLTEELILFGRIESSTSPSVIPALAFQAKGNICAVSPLTLLGAGPETSGASAEAWNQKVLHQYEAFEQDVGRDVWRPELRDSIGAAIKRADNHKRWLWSTQEN